MDEKLFSINEMVRWYSKNVDTEITDDFVINMITKGILKPIELGHYSLNELNCFLLTQYDNQFLKNDDGKFILKENRKGILSKFPKKDIRKPKKFKITSLDGNKMKLIKLN